MADYSKQDVGELQKQIADKRESLRSFRFGGAGSRTRNVREGRTLRREIAQMMTELRKRDLAALRAQARQAGIATKAKNG